MIDYYGFLLLVIMLILVPGKDYIIITKNTIASGGRKSKKTKTAMICLLFRRVIAVSIFDFYSAESFSGNINTISIPSATCVIPIAVSLPFHDSDCHMANHSEPITTKPTYQIRKMRMNIK